MCHIFTNKLHAHPTPSYPFVTVGPFIKWEDDFTIFHLAWIRGHKYIIVAIDYFTKWAKSMPIFFSDDETKTHFIFNQDVAMFWVPKEIVTSHASHFQNKMMIELVAKLGF
jgi:hypothetical protein